MKKKDDLMEALVRLARITKRYTFNGAGHMPRIDRLTAVLLNNEGLSLKDLAMEMDVRPSSLSEQLDALERDGCLSRIKDENDARVFRVFLTDKGREKALEATERAQNVSKLYENCFSEEEKETFIRLSMKLYNFLSDNDHDGRGESQHRHHRDHHDHHDHHDHERHGPHQGGRHHGHDRHGAKHQDHDNK